MNMTASRYVIFFFLSPDTINLLKQLAIDGHEVSKDKLWLHSATVKYLGQRVSKEGRFTDPETLKRNPSLCLPRTKKQSCGFLGLAGYSRN